MNTPELVDPFMAPPSTPSPPVTLIAGSEWNPCHPNSFAKLEEVIKFELPASSLVDPKYDWVTVETVPESPIEFVHTSNKAEVLDKFLNFNSHNEAGINASNSTSVSPTVAPGLESPLMSSFDNSPMDVKPLTPFKPKYLNDAKRVTTILEVALVSICHTQVQMGRQK
ncbi:hypothetical protein DSO57_1021884 [Entomophthora muscae]|uniref:Uncharacterized protein n=1 Tax=Entomophthora muscae TaxID=34485 RepID=A0ACC2SFX1_9FUNG|nr:hypothetical protein DSO57_1021884 [Entomophthora muscae]